MIFLFFPHEAIYFTHGKLRKMYFTVCTSGKQLCWSSNKKKKFKTVENDI